MTTTRPKSAYSQQQQQHSSSGSSSSSSQAIPLCTEHREPAVKLQCKNGANRDRFFWKCRYPTGQQCRFFQWDDRQPNKQQQQQQQQASAGPSSSTAAIAARGNANANAFAGAGSGNVLGARTTTPGPGVRHTLASSGTSGSTTEASQSQTQDTMQGSPAKRRRRLSWQNDSVGRATAGVPDDDDDDSYSSHPSRGVRPNGPTQASHPPPPPPPLTQTAEEALEDDIFDDIDEFDDIQASNPPPPSTPPRGHAAASATFGGSSSSMGNAFTSPSEVRRAKFTTFAAGNPTTPTTPPRLAPGLPVTPMSMAKSAGRSSTHANSSNKWSEIVNDPQYQARRNALLHDSPSTANILRRQPAGDSQESGSGDSVHTSPLIKSQELVVDNNEGSASSPSKASTAAAAASSVASTPTKRLSTLQEDFSKFTTTHVESLTSLQKQVETLERQLKAAKTKCAWHERHEKQIQAELAESKRLVEALKSELTETRFAMGLE